MKKIILLAALVCGMVSCQVKLEEDFVEERPGATRLTAEIEPELKTSLFRQDQNTSKVLWSAQDEISVFYDGAAQAHTFSLTEGAGTTRGTFSGERKANSEYIAFYPKSMSPTLGGGVLQFTLPAEQTYQKDGFAGGTFPMAAKSGSSALTFSNLCSVLRLSVTGHHPVTRIVFRSNTASDKVCGKSQVSFSDAPSLSVLSTGCDSVALVFPKSVQLNEETPEDFYLVLPAKTYKNGFTVRVYTNNRYMDKVYGSDFTMLRSTLHPADAFVFQPNGFDDSTTLEGEGTESEPFLIKSIGDLLLMRDAVNAGEDIKGIPAATAWYKLTEDIDLSPVCGASLGKNWTPIGLSEEKPFSGIFNGDFHEIRKLYINGVSGDYQGLFGYLETTVKNLKVRGSIAGSGYNVGLVAGYSNGTIANCESYGKVDCPDGNYIGGVVGTAASVEDSVNEAEVTGHQYVAGIVGYSSPGAVNCINRGKVTGYACTGGIIGGFNYGVYGCTNTGEINSGNYTGGIVGNQNYGLLFNCWNSGKVTGKAATGGISGYSRQTAKVYNSGNSGIVSGTMYVGGITGYLGSSYSTQTPATVMNCINYGSVTASNESAIGAVVGYNQAADETNGYMASVVTQSYWLYDAGKGLGMAVGIGINDGEFSSDFALTDSQMKGTEAASEVLYKASGTSYSRIVDALNACAWDMKSELYGWKYDAGSGYPVLSGVEAQRPGGSQEAFSVSVSSFELLAGESEIELSVVSTLEYTMDLPDWITKISERPSQTSAYTTFYTLLVHVNDTGADRVGKIVFTNTEGSVLKTVVTQRGARLDLDASQVNIPYSGDLKKVNISSTVAWTASCDAAWCSVSPAKGFGDAVLVIKASENESYSARTATVRVCSADGRFSREVSVVQSGKVDENDTDWKQHPFVHQSLVMRFTATWCGYCPNMNKAVHEAMDQLPGKIQHLALHAISSDLVFSPVTTLISQYGITGYPTGIVDGRIRVGNYSSYMTTASYIVDAVQQTEQTYGTVTGAAITSSVSGNTAGVDVDVYLKKAGDYKITVLLVEDGIINSQADNYDGNHSAYTHDDVARVAVNDISGEAFSVSSDLSVKHFSYSATIPSGCNAANMRVLVYVQRTFGSDTVIQTDSSYGDYFVDNCATVALGYKLKLALEGNSGGGGGNEGITPGGDINM